MSNRLRRRILIGARSLVIAALFVAVTAIDSRPAEGQTMNSSLQEGIWKLENSKGEVSTHYLQIVETGDLQRVGVRRLVLIRDSADRQSRIERIGYVVPGTDLLLLSSEYGRGRATVGLCRLQGSGKFVRAVYTIDRGRGSRGFQVHMQTWTHLGS